MIITKMITDGGRNAVCVCAQSSADLKWNLTVVTLVNGLKPRAQLHSLPRFETSDLAIEAAENHLAT
jgi:hypothetical protein